ncbi:fungal-specific transcription factor domain-containing protein [Aspergillus ambiguus]|uniref:transcription factor domain-containing protein n=1 Tax=Aspergillus ambiguus TaxID=176160 RepID=UPI003CCC9AB9
MMDDQPTSTRSPRDAPVVKRRRVALACDSCRARKSRCDGARPKCSLCGDLGFECVYTPPSTSTNIIVQKDYLQDLEGRVKSLENSLSTVRDNLSGLSSRVEQGYEPKNITARVEAPRPESIPDLAGTEDSVDGMGTVRLAEEEDSGFFGPSSNVAFLRHLTRGIINSGKVHGTLSASVSDTGACEGGFVNASRPPSPPARHENRQFKRNRESIFTLPPHKEMLDLINTFFSDTGLLFPYIHPSTFLENYHQMVRENFKRVRRTWLGLLNMILAMSTITRAPGRTDAGTRISESDVFYQRGLGLCGSEILRGTTLEVVQYLLLMGQYLQGTQKSVQAWTVHGLAVKAALQLGLHSRAASKAFSSLEQEIRKRTWYGCVVLDRTLSMTFGRPSAIPDNYVKLDLPAMNGSMDTSSMRDNDTSSLSIAFFNSTITLYKQMWNIIDILYGQNLGCDALLSVSEIVAHVFSVEQHLFSWEKCLPDSLRLVSPASIREVIQEPTNDFQSLSWKFRVILTLRYLNLRVLLHRPVLVRFIDACGGFQPDPQELKLLQQIGLNSMQICADSAMEIIDIVYEVVQESERGQNLLGAWWFSLYYTFNSALVILSTLWVSREENITGKPMDSLVNKSRPYPCRAITALLKLDSGNRMIDRCRVYLEQFTNTLNIQGEGYMDANSMSAQQFGYPCDGTVAQPTDFDFSPLGMEFGEFMVDGDLLALVNRPEPLGTTGFTSNLT